MAIRHRCWLLLGLCAVPAYPQDPPAPPITRGPYLQALLDTSVEIRWSSLLPVVGSVIYRREGGEPLTAEEVVPGQVHALKIAGLTPGARYRYQIFHGDVLMNGEGHVFRTSPPPGDVAIRVTVAGDSGWGGEEQLAVAKVMEAMAPDLFLHTGDLDYLDNADRSIFGPYRPLLATAGFFPSKGNHDLLLPWLDLFSPPNPGGGSKTFYSFDWGSAHFVALDDLLDEKVLAEERVWLEADLQRSRDRGVPWNIVYFHVPIFTIGAYANTKEPEKVAGLFLDLLDRFQVDLVLNGHDHNYQRSHPVREKTVRDGWQRPRFVSPRGTIYIVTGGGGSQQLYAQFPPADRRFNERFVRRHHAVELVITARRIEVRAIAPALEELQEETIDEFTIEKGPPPPALPFLRGDANPNGVIDLSDAVAILDHLFLGGSLKCPVAADADGTGPVELTDAVIILNYLFLAGAPPVPPFPACGSDPAADDAWCVTTACPW